MIEQALNIVGPWIIFFVVGSIIAYFMEGKKEDWQKARPGEY